MPNINRPPDTAPATAAEADVAEGRPQCAGQPYTREGTAERAHTDATLGVHDPPDQTGDHPTMVEVWQNELDRRVYERAHTERRRELQEAGTPYVGESPGSRVPRRERRKRKRPE